MRGTESIIKVYGLPFEERESCKPYEGDIEGFNGWTKGIQRDFGV